MAIDLKLPRDPPPGPAPGLPDVPPAASEDLAIALGGLELVAEAGGVWTWINVLVECVEALARARAEDVAELQVWRREAARQAKVCDTLVGRLAALEARVGPPDDGK